MDTSTKLAIGFGISCGVLLTILIIVIIIIVRKLKSGNILKTAILTAFKNKNECDTPGVLCEFTPDTALLPPIIGLSRGIFSTSIARYGAELTTRLREATGNMMEPENLTSITTLGLINTVESKNICWITQNSDKSQTWIVFRGTHNAVEWERDFDTVQVPFFNNGDLVHRGFNNIYESIKTQIRDILNSIQSTTLIISGHSLGAALGILLTADLIRDPLVVRPSIRTYVFAPPKVGNTKFVNNVTNAIGATIMDFYCVANKHDIIPTLPLSVEPNFNDPENPNLYEQFALYTFSENWGSLLLNHSMPIYIKNIDNLNMCL